MNVTQDPLSVRLLQKKFRNIELKLNFPVPPTSPTRHQLISGIGVPLQLENEAITLGYVFKAFYFLVSDAEGEIE